MNDNIFCNRKGGVTIKGKFYPHPRVSEILAKQIEKMADKVRDRDIKRQKKAAQEEYLMKRSW